VLPRKAPFRLAVSGDKDLRQRLAHRMTSDNPGVPEILISPGRKCISMSV
jgi:hypothetical protein